LAVLHKETTEINEIVVLIAPGDVDGVVLVPAYVASHGVVPGPVASSVVAHVHL